MSHFGAKKSFFKLFTFTYSAQSPWFIIWILRTWGTKFLGPIRDKKCPILRPKKFFQDIHYCHLWLRIVPYHCAKFKKILSVASKEKMYKGLSQIWGKTVPRWRQKEVLQIIDHRHFCSIAVPYYCKKFHKKLSKFWEKGLQAFGPSLG